MWVTFLDWFLGIFCVLLWATMFALYEKDRVIAWIDNKFGPDDPMPPIPTTTTENNVDKSMSISASPPETLILGKDQETPE